MNSTAEHAESWLLAQRRTPTAKEAGGLAELARRLTLAEAAARAATERAAWWRNYSAIATAAVLLALVVVLVAS